MEKKTKRFALAVAASLTLSSAAYAQRYNTDTRILPTPTKEEIERGRATADMPADKASPKEWATLLNPAYEEFWTEGNFKPDAGFLLFARNPTPENAKNWLLRMETKAKVTTKMYALIESAQIELIKSGQMQDRYNVLDGLPKIGRGSIKEATALPADVTIYLIFRPECSACHALAKLLAPLKNQVQPLQAPLPIPLRGAGEQLQNIEGLRASAWADAQTMQRYVNGTVPVLLIYSSKSNQVTKVDRPGSLPQIMGVAAYVSNQKS